ncbi:tape measure domain protein, partial [gut metagenome]
MDRLRAFATQLATVRGEFQKFEIAFETMLGSKAQADALMQQLIQTAATTPFGMTDIAGSAKQLLAYGLEAEKVNDTLIRLGDIAAGLSIPINDLAYLYGTTMVQGRLYTQDLNQFLGRGIPLMEELAKQFGVTKAEVKGLVEEGRVGFPHVQKAIESLTGEASKFGGLMADQSKTIAGQISNLEDSIEQMLNQLGKESQDVISGTLNVASSLVESYEQVGRTIIGLVGTYGAYRTAVMVSAAATKGWTIAEMAHFKALVVVEKAQKLLNRTMLTNPYVLVATAVASLVAVMMSLKTETERIREAEKRYNEEKERRLRSEKK